MAGVVAHGIQARLIGRRVSRLGSLGMPIPVLTLIHKYLYSSQLWRYTLSGDSVSVTDMAERCRMPGFSLQHKAFRYILKGPEVLSQTDHPDEPCRGRFAD